ncbi:Hsp33 family molecular chaperone HslO [Pigmentibacter ruber]|uniref:Hsp33 family molecular chaperone HslO n=1 Tax=Pigmentibacter ruber TaxID=2683196 RepID=UPI00131B67B2|nr:Hsp33 family molecular chaperone HslO [Pigmentibacter ruber]
MFQDYLFFGVDTKVHYSYRMLHLSHLVEEAKQLHNLNTNRALLLSDALLGSVLLSSILDYEERVNLRFHCNSDFTIGTETSYQAETRGYIECNENSEVVKQLDLGNNIIPEYQVRSMRSQRKKPNLFEGLTVSKSDSIEKALNEHLATSYQMNTYLKISSWISPENGKINAFGVIYQELPDIPEEVSIKLKNHIDSLPSMKELFLIDSDADILSKKLIPDATKAVKSINPKFVCSCSQERVENVIVTLPLNELSDILNKAEDLEMKCHYCNKNYIVSMQTISQIYASRNQVNSTNSNEMN